MTWFLLQSLRRHSETAGYSASMISHEREREREREFSQMVSESRDLSIMRLAVANIVGVPRALFRRSKGKEKKRERGRRRREAKEGSYVCGGPVRRPACELCVSQKCQGSEHARMNIIQLVIRERTSLGWPHEP